MEITIITVSKQCSAIMYQDKIHLEQLDYPDINELHNAIHKLYPTLYIMDYRLYWRYSRDYFLEIIDFLSYLTVLTLMVDRSIYLVLEDCDEHCDGNEEFIRMLDRKEEEEEREKQRSKYDVEIPRKADIPEEKPDETEPVGFTQRSDKDIMTYALRHSQEIRCYTADLLDRHNRILDIKKAMKGEIISCTHKDIYFLETNTKSENSNLENLFASPAGREMLKYKSRTKLKQKTNSAIECFIHNAAVKPSSQQMLKASQNNNTKQSASTSSDSPVNTRSSCRRSSFDLYEEAATILGLTCSQTDNCRCIECQCHYFDFEEEMDFPTGSECVMDHNSSCSIQ